MLLFFWPLLPQEQELGSSEALGPGPRGGGSCPWFWLERTWALICYFTCQYGVGSQLWLHLRNSAKSVTVWPPPGTPILTQSCSQETSPLQPRRKASGPMSVLRKNTEDIVPLRAALGLHWTGGFLKTGGFYLLICLYNLAGNWLVSERCPA